jgi:hypothetical protein
MGLLASLPFCVAGVGPRDSGATYFAAVVVLGFSGVFLLWGYLAVRGRLRDPLGPGLLSVGVAAVPLALVGAFFLAMPGPVRTFPRYLLIVCGLCTVGSLLLAAGLLALGWRTPYRHWKARCRRGGEAE